MIGGMSDLSTCVSQHRFQHGHSLPVLQRIQRAIILHSCLMLLSATVRHLSHHFCFHLYTHTSHYCALIGGFHVVAVRRPFCDLNFFVSSFMRMYYVLYMLYFSCGFCEYLINEKLKKSFAFLKNESLFQKSRKSRFGHPTATL